MLCLARWTMCLVTGVGEAFPWLVMLFGRGDALGVLLTTDGGLTITPYQGVGCGRIVGVNGWIDGCSAEVGDTVGVVPGLYELYGL